MRPVGPILLAAAAALVGCPLPQPLPDYPPGTVTPPRIVVDDSEGTISQPGTIVRVPAGCATAPVVSLDAQIRDATTFEAIEVRWFVNYDPTSMLYSNPLAPETVMGNVPTDPTLRDITPFAFRPYDFPSAIDGSLGSLPGALHVVELVVSNGFFSPAEDAPMPNRSPAPGFEVQVYRWVFLNDSSVPCP